jgi:DNA-binding transcriptional ArsR family regulator
MAALTGRRGHKLKTVMQAAVCHPLRLRVFAILAERVASPSELARELVEPVGNVSYHIGALVEAKLVEEVDNRPVRGAVEHFYKAVELPYISDDQEGEMAECARVSMTETVVAMYAANVAQAMSAGTLLRRGDHHLTRTVMNVDEEGWQEMREAYTALYDRAVEIQTASAQRMGESDEKPMRILSYQSLFELPLTAKTE